MKKTRVNEEVLKMRFDDVYGRYKGKQIRTDEAAELLGISVKTFYRKRERYEEEGFNGRFDYRFGKVSANRAADSEVEKMTRLYEERYRGFNIKHFHEFAQREHGLKYGYTWAKNTLSLARDMTE
jgi:transposase